MPAVEGLRLLGWAPGRQSRFGVCRMSMCPPAVEDEVGEVQVKGSLKPACAEQRCPG